MHAFGQHALAVARAAVADCERCAAAHAVRELRARWRALLLGLPAAAAYAAVAQQSKTRRRLGTHRSRRPPACPGLPARARGERGPAARWKTRGCGGARPPARTRRARCARPCGHTWHSAACCHGQSRWLRRRCWATCSSSPQSSYDSWRASTGQAWSCQLVHRPTRHTDLGTHRGTVIRATPKPDRLHLVAHARTRARTRASALSAITNQRVETGAVVTMRLKRSVPLRVLYFQTPSLLSHHVTSQFKAARDRVQ